MTVTRSGTVAATHMGGAAATVRASSVWWDEAEQLARDAEQLRRQVLGLTRRVATHYGPTSTLTGISEEAGQMAAAGLLGLKRLLDARGL